MNEIAVTYTKNRPRSLDDGDARADCDQHHGDSLGWRNGFAAVCHEPQGLNAEIHEIGSAGDPQPRIRAMSGPGLSIATVVTLTTINSFSVIPA